MSKQKFLSLRWKFTAPLAILSIVGFSLLYWISQQQFHKQLEQEQQKYHRQQEQEIIQQFEGKLSQLMAVAPSVARSAIDYATAQTPIQAPLLTGLLNSLAINNITLFNQDGSIQYQHLQENQLPELLSWTKHNLGLNQPKHTALCHQLCTLYVLAPVTSTSGDQHTILLSSPLHFQLSEQEDFPRYALGEIRRKSTSSRTSDTSVNKPAQESPQPHIKPHTDPQIVGDHQEIRNWKMRIFNLKASLPVHQTLGSAAQSYHYSELERVSVLVKQDKKQGETLRVSLKSILNSRHTNLHLITVDKASPIHSMLGPLAVKPLLFTLGFVALLITVFFRLISTYARKLNTHAQVLELLEERKFEEVRRYLRTNYTALRYLDEFDLVGQSILTFSYQLDASNKATDIHNREMERRTLFDSLTGLANRNRFMMEVEQDVQRFVSKGGVLAVVIMDLDNFKRVNDSLNHRQGDILLSKLALRLKHSARSLGLVARLGGDEYAILVRNADKPSQLNLLGKKILDLINRPLTLESTSVVISASIGIAIAGQNDGPGDLMKNAELAMYKAKKSGGNDYQVYNAVMADQAQNELSLESEIRRALDDGEFTLYLQPKLNCANQICGFETLARWDHPDRGILSPLEFIPTMENMGAINRLDNWVLEASCRQLQVWQELYPDITLSVNISSSQFTDKNFLIFLQQCLKKYSMDPKLLELEITETLLMENMKVGLEVINNIKKLGIQIAIDDFGTGYSSLSYLKKLPVDTLKIDREFIKDIPENESAMQISSVILFLAKQLNFKVVAEGVETMDQIMFLESNHCDLMQGYYFSAPIPAHQAMIMLESQRFSQDTDTKQSSVV